MYEQVAKDRVKERLNEGIESQRVHRAIASRRTGPSLGSRIAQWFAHHRILKRQHSHEEPMLEREHVNLQTGKETPSSAAIQIFRIKV